MIPRHLLIAVAVMMVVVMAMGLYMWHMRVRVAGVPPSTADNRPVAPPVLGPTEQVTLYVANDDSGTVQAQAARIPLPAGRQQRAEELLRAVVLRYLEPASAHPLPAGSEIRDVYLVDPGIAIIDVNEALANGHRSGILVEELTVATLVQTLAANVQGVSRVKILVEGKQQDTLAGHADLSNFYDVSAINQMINQLEAP